MITSKEIASICGVSQGTVDRALHDRPGISATTKDKILKVVEDKGFQANVVASELVSGKSKLVGAIIPSVNSIFFLDILNTIQEEIKKDGLRIHITSSKDKDDELDIIKEFVGRRCKAIIIVSLQIDVNKLERFAKTTPIISLINPLNSKFIRSLVPNAETTGKLGTQHLLDIGHKKILYGELRNYSYSSTNRYKGYKNAMLNAGLVPKKYDIYGNMSNLSNYMKKEKYTALFCHNDEMALYVIRHLKENGLRIPQDIAVMGVDGQKTFRQLCPGITTMAYPVKEIAKATSQFINNEYASLIVPDCTLLIDESTVI